MSLALPWTLILTLHGSLHPEGQLSCSQTNKATCFSLSLYFLFFFFLANYYLDMKFKIHGVYKEILWKESTHRPPAQTLLPLNTYSLFTHGFPRPIQAAYTHTCIYNFSIKDVYYDLYYSVVYLLLAFAFFFIFYFIFIIFNSYFPDTIFFLLYSMVTQLHILFLHITMLHHKWLDIVPSATQQDLIAYSFQKK